MGCEFFLKVRWGKFKDAYCFGFRILLDRKLVVNFIVMSTEVQYHYANIRLIYLGALGLG